ncbi:hypothetical protein C6568_00845 [Melaminivora suipulveris]|uniref:Transmembrane protein n=1 Tax=Melaminivora suipulveris TaxID=2109913 RepID=A0A2R3Q8G4_9BURK|nr:hypothetical protein [Melaminivora suipulveris]AVO47964.1 hypothetical protein C6568_00845 [Melaminivora suipulveris]
MYLVAIAWLYVTLMMAIAEAVAPRGSVLGAAITFVLYGLLPLSIVLYILATPARRRARRARENARLPAAHSRVAPDEGGHAAGAAQGRIVAPVREEP